MTTPAPLDRFRDQHWLIFNDDRQIVRCHCGFGADVDTDCGWGDSVLVHIEEAARADERERIASAIEAERRRHWQEHLRLHPHAIATSCPGCYATHDALAYAVNVARRAQAVDTETP